MHTFNFLLFVVNFFKKLNAKEGVPCVTFVIFDLDLSDKEAAGDARPED